MEFSPEIIKKVAKLAKIRLSDAEVETFNQQFAAISQIIGDLQNVDTSNVEPITNVSPNKTLFRKDEVKDGNYVNDIMFNAPKSSYNCFVVPKVVE
jgi:aspartyl-tRNA(Asn)/glutamyl-tRNA(Gln) amidotransferase subunit C